MDQALRTAREIMCNITPLRFDCGRLCGAACCAPDEEGDGGMLLFPGEEALYEPLPEGFEIVQTELGKLLVCDGVCERELRPLSCMLFPLWPSGEAEAPVVRLDARGRGVCPLCRESMSALKNEFRQAVTEAGAVLLKEPVHKAFLNRVARYADEFTAVL